MKYNTGRNRYYDPVLGLWRKVNLVIIIVSVVTIGINMVKLLG